MITPALSSLDHTNILRSLGVQPEDRESQSLRQLERQISQCEEKILQVSSPRVVYRILPTGQMPPGLLRGSDIRRLLDGCDEAVLMALTLGADLEKLLIREEVTNMSDAFVLDACASEAVEEAADDFENKLREEMHGSGKYLTNRFSPGYGDYPISVQRQLLECLNALRAIGLTLTPTDLMVPRKSITAILGISCKAKPDVLGGCGQCPIREKCSYRAHGKRCWKKD